MKVVAVRHGQSQFNEQQLYNDIPDSADTLAPSGIEQATTLAHELANNQFDVVYCSEFPRTKQTAEIINTSQVPLQVEKDLNERITGFNLKPLSDMVAYYDDDWFKVPENGESFADFKTRINNFLGKLALSTHNQVLLVTHKAVIKLLIAKKEGLSDQECIKLDPKHLDIVEFDL